MTHIRSEQKCTLTGKFMHTPGAHAKTTVTFHILYSVSTIPLNINWLYCALTQYALRKAHTNLSANNQCNSKLPLVPIRGRLRLPYCNPVRNVNASVFTPVSSIALILSDI